MQENFLEWFADLPKCSAPRHALCQHRNIGRYVPNAHVQQSAASFKICGSHCSTKLAAVSATFIVDEFLVEQLQSKIPTFSRGKGERLF